MTDNNDKQTTRNDTPVRIHKGDYAKLAELAKHDDRPIHIKQQVGILIRAVHDLRWPFSLTCIECDAGEEIKSKKEADLLGWRDVIRDVTGISWNDVGICPGCAPEYYGETKTAR